MIDVLITPGQIAVTPTPWGSQSAARPSDNVSTADFVEQYAVSVLRGV